MNEEDIKTDFVNRCIILGEWLRYKKSVETSPRVWVSVMIELLKEICNEQEDSEGAMKQIIFTLEHDYGETA